jgi:DNA polymerase III subunit epsilon
MDWKNLNFVCLDINGTGPNHFEKEGIIEIGAVKIKKGKITKEKFFKKLNPEIEIPQFISVVHNIFEKDVKDKPLFKNIAEDFFSFLGQAILVCHNCSNEKRLLSKFAPNYDSLVFLDTVNIARNIFKNMQSYSLQSITKQLKIEVLSSTKEVTYTSSLYEAEACAAVFKYLINELPKENQNLEYIKKIGLIDTYRRTKNVPATKFNND